MFCVLIITPYSNKFLNFLSFSHSNVIFTDSAPDKTGGFSFSPGMIVSRSGLGTIITLPNWFRSFFTCVTDHVPSAIKLNVGLFCHSGKRPIIKAGNQDPSVFLISLFQNALKQERFYGPLKEHSLLQPLLLKKNILRLAFQMELLRS